jgi:multiple sugar transport system permease protein
MSAFQDSSQGQGMPRLALIADRYNPFHLLGHWSDGRFWVVALLAPAVILLALIVIYPLFYGLSLSVHEMRLTRPELGTGFVGLKHFVAMLSDDVFWLAVRNTFLWVGIACVLEVGLGMVSALALNRALPGLKLIAVLVLLPWFLPKVVAGNMWALMLDPRLGVLNDILVQLGILAQYKAWFSDPATAFGTAVVIEAWCGFPFFTLLFMAGLKGIPNELYEAASIDGATATQRFRFVTLPMLRNVMLVAVILRVISLVNSPDLLLILTQGGPGHSTLVLSLYAFETAYRGFDFGYGSALAVVMLIILMLFTFLYVRTSGVGRQA